MTRHLAAFALAAVLVATVAVVAPPARAQGMTADQAAEMLNELRQIRQLLEKQVPPPPPPAPDENVNIEFPATGGYSMGKADAPLVFVEYTDFECPFCQQYHLNAFEQVKAQWVDTGKLRYISRDFPLDFHPNARRAAIAARCAADQGKYWELRNTMIRNADKLGGERISGYAKEVGLDVKKLETCMASDFYKAGVDKDVAEGNSAGVTGTPSFVVGRLENGRLVGVRIVGAMPYPDIEAKIREVQQQAPK